MLESSKKKFWIFYAIGAGLGVFLPDIAYKAFVFMLLSAFLLVYNVEKDDGIKKRWLTIFISTALSAGLCCLIIMLQNIIISKPLVVEELVFSAMICVSFCLIINIIFLILLDFLKKKTCYVILGAAFLYVFIVANTFATFMKMITRSLDNVKAEISYMLPWDLFTFSIFFFVVGSVISLYLHQYCRKKVA